MTNIKFDTIRHIQTINNKNNLYSGMYGSAPTEEGLKQAKALKLDKYDYIISSPLDSCLKTIQEPYSIHQVDSRLLASYIGDLANKSYKAISPNKNYLDDNSSNNETGRQTWLRVVSLLYELAYRTKVEPGKNYLLVTSNSIIRLLKATQHRTRLKNIAKIKTGNCNIDSFDLKINQLDYLLKI